jgi:hypothetical protein
MQVRPIHHHRPGLVVNHVRGCFWAYWLNARLSVDWRGKRETGEVPALLRELQNIRIGYLHVGQNGEKSLTRM